MILAIGNMSIYIENKRFNVYRHATLIGSFGTFGRALNHLEASE